ncbi:MAG: preprotein translocase subunit SecE [Candidatus Saccharimonadales bacterium]
MANSTKDSKNAKPRKRIVKNPETFREKALKATEQSDKPTRRSRARQRSGKLVSPVFRPVGRTAGKVFRRKPFRILGRILLPTYLRSAFSELREVQWPKWKTARDLTFAVLVFAIAFGVVIAIVDYGLDRLFRDVLIK